MKSVLGILLSILLVVNSFSQDITKSGNVVGLQGHQLPTFSSNTYPLWNGSAWTAGNLLNSNNSWTGTNSFNNIVNIQGANSSTDPLLNIISGDASVTTTLDGKKTVSISANPISQFTNNGYIGQHITSTSGSNYTSIAVGANQTIGFYNSTSSPGTLSIQVPYSSTNLLSFTSGTNFFPASQTLMPCTIEIRIVCIVSGSSGEFYSFLKFEQGSAGTTTWLNNNPSSVNTTTSSTIDVTTTFGNSGQNLTLYNISMYVEN